MSMSSPEGMTGTNIAFSGPSGSVGKGKAVRLPGNAVTGKKPNRASSVVQPTHQGIAGGRGGGRGGKGRKGY